MDEDCIAVAEGADLLITGGTSHFTVPWRSFLAQGLQVHLQSTQTRSWWNVRSLNVSASVPHHFHFYLLRLSNAGVSMKCDMCLTLSQPWRISNSGLQRIPRCPAKALWLHGARGCLSQRWCEAHRLLHQVCSAEVWWGSWGVLGKLGSWVWVPSAMMPVKWQFVYYLCPLLDFTEEKRGFVLSGPCARLVDGKVKDIEEMCRAPLGFWSESVSRNVSLPGFTAQHHDAHSGGLEEMAQSRGRTFLRTCSEI